MPVGDELDDGSNVTSTKGSVGDSQTVSILYLVGLDGVGHRDITPMLSVIARSCRYHVEYRPQALQDIMLLPDPDAIDSRFSLYLRKTAEMGVAHKSKVIIIDQFTLPRNGLLRDSNVHQEQQKSTYSLQKLFNRGLKEGINIKMLYLKRNFYDIVASHTDYYSGSFENRVRILQSFIKHLASEYAAISSKDPDSWNTVHYEWFAKMSDCAVLVSAIIDFAGWDRCDVEHACQALKRTAFKAAKPAVDEKNYRYAQTVNVDTDIPVLDLSRDRTYRFKPWTVPLRTESPPAIAVPAKQVPLLDAASKESPLVRAGEHSAPHPQAGRGMGKQQMSSVLAKQWKPREKIAPG
jgi:hypothetical protein